MLCYIMHILCEDGRRITWVPRGGFCVIGVETSGSPTTVQVQQCHNLHNTPLLETLLTYADMR